jgi:hypothetical protein
VNGTLQGAAIDRRRIRPWRGEALSMLVLNPQWRQAAGIIGAGMACPPLLGWALGRFPAPWAFVRTNPISVAETALDE